MISFVLSTPWHVAKAVKHRLRVRSGFIPGYRPSPFPSSSVCTLLIYGQIIALSNAKLKHLASEKIFAWTMLTSSVLGELSAGLL